ncbi:MAG: aminomethyl-transferring glycine dehydrogenase [Phycisphaeraceae bacterium]|nr:aminomethyl-transferring glycine dehydrogenase [Phycisphaeraceae bacterium]
MTTHAVPSASSPIQVGSSCCGKSSCCGGQKPEVPSVLQPSDMFAPRHIGPTDQDIAAMLSTLGLGSLDELVDQTIPSSIRLTSSLELKTNWAQGEAGVLHSLRAKADKNVVYRSMIGMGYYDTLTPAVILRNIIENPGWYTQYTPYQAEISQGRLEALLNFQTMVADLTGFELAGASLLDEPTAAAEAMTMCVAITGRTHFLVADHCHPQTIAVVKTRAKAVGTVVEVMPADALASALTSRKDDKSIAGILLQYPTTDGSLIDPSKLAALAHDAGAQVVVATDLLACTLIKPPAELGADIAIGTSQRFGVPMGFGGPHAAFIATSAKHARKLPGRIIGVSKDSHGNTAYRMAIQTREQHIKRERATSNICTAQALLAIVASMYGVYHGPDGLRTIAHRVHNLAAAAIVGIESLGHETIGDTAFFDTLRVKLNEIDLDSVLEAAEARNINFRLFADGTLGISLDETTTTRDLRDVLTALNGGTSPSLNVDELHTEAVSRGLAKFGELERTTAFMAHPVFNSYHSETDLLRYMKKLENRDLSLAHSMIPLGSCTMKLNATSEMIPVTWPEFGRIHPFAPADQWRGYAEMFKDLERWLSSITGFHATSLQPNAGSQGEFAGLLAIKAYHESRGEGHRNICLIPTSAHGTNPASAITAGYKVVAVACDAKGNIDLADLRTKAEQHKDTLAAIMVTYPSTHGVFEKTIRDLCAIVHEFGGQVYLDGANMNAMVGLCRPGDIGADVCHLNLHKTFSIPHGGGGPGMGPICTAEHLTPFLPGNPLEEVKDNGVGPVSAAHYSSASVLTISWMYIAMMGEVGLRKASQVAILNANYMANRLKDHYTIVYTGENNRVAHEFILDCRSFEKSAGIRIDDIAKRLMDYGFHAPTMAWPVPGTLMIEPTESEPKAELDRLCDALISIREEIAQIEQGTLPRDDNPLVHSPHTIAAVSNNTWSHPYSRETAAFPAAWLRDAKFWPHVGRVDNPYGDRNLMCSCPSVDEVVAN